MSRVHPNSLFIDIGSHVLHIPFSKYPLIDMVFFFWRGWGVGGGRRISFGGCELVTKPNPKLIDLISPLCTYKKLKA